MGGATLSNTGQTFQGSESTYNAHGTFTENIPAGAVQAVIECFSASASGGARATSGCSIWGGGGGGSGSYAKKTLNVAGQGGKTLDITVGAAGPGTTTSVSSGTLAITTITTNSPSTNGGNASIGSGGTAGPGGVVGSGGDTNTAGNAGTAGSLTGRGLGGAGIVGTNGTGPSGGVGAFSSGAGSGVDGLIVIKYT